MTTEIQEKLLDSKWFTVEEIEPDSFIIRHWKQPGGNGTDNMVHGYKTYGTLSMEQLEDLREWLQNYFNSCL